MNLGDKAISRILGHIQSNPTTAVLGLIITSSSSLVAIPLSHSLLPLASFYEIALAQIQVYTSLNQSKLSGIYFSNELVGDTNVPIIVSKLAEKITENCKECVVIKCDVSLDPVFTLYNLVDGAVKLSKEKVLDKVVLSEYKSRIKVYDFENHLDKIELSWLPEE